MLQTVRLRLQPLGENFRGAFAALHADAEVAADLGGPLDRAASDQKLDRYLGTLRAGGSTRWAVEDHQGRFLGYSGVMARMDTTHPLGPHHEVGWRFMREAWGKGYATESARAALDYAFQVHGLPEILSYTSAQNLRSQAVMARLSLRRDPSRDFTAAYGRLAHPWRGLVWVADRPG